MEQFQTSTIDKEIEIIFGFKSLNQADTLQL